MCSCGLNTSTGLEHNSFASKQDLNEKQKGGHLFGYLEEYCLDSLSDNNFDWVTLVPYASQKDFDSPIVRYSRGDTTQMRKRDSMWRSQIDIAQNAGFKVFFKPHVWLHEPTDEKWRSDIYPTSDQNWKSWKESYRAFILRYAEIAEKSNVDMFCIGAEFTRLTKEKPEYWVALIDDIRQVYKGQLTYAANWYKEYEEVSFWNKLDYIGIQAYFPLVKQDNPSLKQLTTGWKKHLPKLDAIYQKHQRKVLFTELGYKSTADSGVEPWRWLGYSPTPVSPKSYETQSRCYQAFFESVWNEKWFGGVHLWQMRCNSRRNGKHSQLDFTPLGKPAEKIIANGFKK